MNESRPNPDKLLAQVKAEESQARRGALKIFFGYAAGVGKTFEMLEAARRSREMGCDVVVGYLEPHVRPDTLALAAGLPALPTKELEYRGVKLREFDIDLALSRHPELLLLDELAHTNADGSRHTKRWQDVEELLAYGINVWTTLNVQHIESLNDVLGQITGVVVRETVPDSIFEAADEIALIDIAPEDLLRRLEAGKIYRPDQAQRAMESFFQKSNLDALRELALRQAARRIHTDVESARRRKSISRPWATSERLLVCVGPSPTTARVVRTARRLASALDGSWLAVSVDVTGGRITTEEKSRIADHFRLAERLGAETATLSGEDVARTILDYARERNVTKIVIGKTKSSRWRRWVRGSVVDNLLEKSGDIDVYVIRGENEEHAPAVPVISKTTLNWRGMCFSASVIAACGFLAATLRSLRFADTEANAIMLFLAGVVFVAYRLGSVPAIAASLLAVIGFDFFFVPPTYSFAVTDAQYIVTFGVMLAIGLLISTLTSRLRAQVEATRLRERRTSALYQLGKQLSSLYGGVFLISAAAEKMSEIIGGEVAVYLRTKSTTPQLAFGHNTSVAKNGVSVAVAAWVIEHDQIAGANTSTLPNAGAVFFPLIGSQQTLGAIALKNDDMASLLAPEQRHMIEACANQTALALERDQMAIDAAEARIQAESEQIRSTMLSSVSHDLKTPLAVITGATSSLLQSPTLGDETRRQLLETVVEEASRLNRLLENILQMSRIDAGALRPNRQWHVLEEIIGSALQHTRGLLANHHLDIKVPTDLPLIFVDGLLLEQVFVNLLENAARYTPAGTQIQIAGSMAGDFLRISVADDGPGIPVGSEQRIFEKFYRSTTKPDGGRGSGLGLAICNAIAKIHGGEITGANRPSGGAEFVLLLPMLKDAPQVDVG